ncbi:archease [Halobaculum gomorrense]|uniref:SHS2 domain-containing protein n=1 Tax=Halobaculum gomorrense TaxID=43928 RepID=A0A1M5SCT4_9EURY|nr:archease [Halobaculum gomorrense]SHH36289.1 SHS2 domain-containing protein [Halobaculum gomorrense]
MSDDTQRDAPDTADSDASGRFELRDHTADVAVAATADSLGGVFAAVADGLTAAMCEEIPDGGDRFDLRVRAESPEAALFDYLDQCIYERDVRAVLPSDHRATVRSDGDGWLVEASARGIPLADVVARDVKAVTYSEMELAETDGGWRAYVVFDV